MERLRTPEQQTLPNYEGIVLASEIIDRQEIEAKAWRLIKAREIPEVPVLEQERKDNARTALMEAMTAKEHLSVVQIHGDTVEDINTQVLSRLLNGWDDGLPQHEKDRRFPEICEELVIQKVHSLILAKELPADTEVELTSDYPEALGSQAEDLGYRKSNKKGMIRSTRLGQNPDGTYTRVIEQVSRSNGTWKSTFSFFEAAKISTKTGKPDIVALEMPLLYCRKDYPGGAMDFMRMLDECSGPDVRYGEFRKAAEDWIAYEDLRQESIRREKQIELYIDNLAILEAQLEDRVEGGQLSFAQRTEIYKGEVNRILDAICVLEPAYAKDTFGEATVAHYENIAVMHAQGNQLEVLALLDQVQSLKQTVTFCGVAISVDKAQEMGLAVNSTGDLIEKGKESWAWGQGVCVVKKCPTRPGKTEVGPCSVCRGCQDEFDGIARPRRVAAKVISIFEKSKNSKTPTIWDRLAA